MPGVTNALAFSGFNPSLNGFTFGLGRLAVDIAPLTLLTATSPLTVQTILLPALPFPMPNYVLESIEFSALTAAGTLVAATFDLKTNAVSLLTAPIALVGITAANLSIKTAGPLTRTVQRPAAVPAALTLTLSQTVDSGNAGTMAGRINLELIPSV